MALAVRRQIAMGGTVDMGRLASWVVDLIGDIDAMRAEKLERERETR